MLPAEQFAVAVPAPVQGYFQPDVGGKNIPVAQGELSDLAGDEPLFKALYKWCVPSAARRAESGAEGGGRPARTLTRQPACLGAAGSWRAAVCSSWNSGPRPSSWSPTRWWCATCSGCAPAGHAPAAGHAPRRACCTCSSADAGRRRPVPRQRRPGRGCSCRCAGPPSRG